MISCSLYERNLDVKAFIFRTVYSTCTTKLLAKAGNTLTMPVVGYQILKYANVS